MQSKIIYLILFFFCMYYVLDEFTGKKSISKISAMLVSGVGDGMNPNNLPFLAPRTKQDMPAQIDPPKVDPKTGQPQAPSFFEKWYQESLKLFPGSA